MRYRFLIALSLLLGLSCDDSTECSTAADCFSSEVCLGGTCLLESEIDLGVEDQAADTTKAPDGSVEMDASVETDANATNNEVQDMMEDKGPDSPVDMEPMLACQVDHVQSTCTDDMWEPNNRWIDGKKLGPQVNLGPGCPSANTFVPLDEVITPVMCARDAADWFYIEFTPCVNSAIRIIWTMIPQDECRSDLIALDSLSYPCDVEANCTATDEMAMVVIDLPATGVRQSQLSYVSVVGDTGVQTPYELRVRVEQR